MLKRPEELHQDVAERGDRGDEAAGTENCLCSRCAAGFGQLIAKLLKVWSRGRELNSRPADYESAALPLSYLGQSLINSGDLHFSGFLFRPLFVHFSANNPGQPRKSSYSA